MDPSESGGANNTNHEEGVHNKAKEVPLSKSQAPPESRATSILEKKEKEEEEKRIFDEIDILLRDLKADGAISLHNQLRKELSERFGSK